jgi:hypothetical protein
LELPLKIRYGLAGTTINRDNYHFSTSVEADLLEQIYHFRIARHTPDRFANSSGISGSTSSQRVFGIPDKTRDLSEPGASLPEEFLFQVV